MKRSDQGLARFSSINTHQNSFEIDTRQYAEVAIWCSLPAALSSRKIVPRSPRLHVHLRKEAGGLKVVDKDFVNLFVFHSGIQAQVTPSASLAFLRSHVGPSADPLFADTTTPPSLRQLIENSSERNPSITAARTVDLDRLVDCDYTIWCSTPALLWTAERPEETGIHVHVARNNKMIIDDTFGEVLLHGKPLDRRVLLEKMIHQTSYCH